MLDIAVVTGFSMNCMLKVEGPHLIKLYSALPHGLA